MKLFLLLLTQILWVVKARPGDPCEGGCYQRVCPHGFEKDTSGPLYASKCSGYGDVCCKRKKACEGECFRNKCPENFYQTELKRGKCENSYDVCCIKKKINECHRLGGFCVGQIYGRSTCFRDYVPASADRRLCSYGQDCCIRDKAVYGHCAVNPDKNLAPENRQRITGDIHIKQVEGSEIEFKFRLKGFDTYDDVAYHGIHVHGFGDLSNGCASAGGHYNPEGMTHGGPNDPMRHIGDLGNFKENPDGTIKNEFTDRLAKLGGAYSILGRAIVIHAGRDDLGQGNNAGSLAHGNAGARLACCVIGVADGKAFNES